MSFHFYRVDSLADEERLLRDKLAMEKQIRKHREKNRRSKSEKSREYSTIFEPVTKSLDDLKDIHKAATSTVITTPSQSQSSDLMKENNLIDESIDDLGLPPPLVPDGKPSSLYLRALDSIPIKSLDDGVFGLNIHTQSIGNNKFTVNDNTLIVENKEDGSIKTFQIKDYLLWKLLLVKRPNDVEFNFKNGKGKNVLNEYLNIVKSLNLIHDAKDRGVSYRTRAKFKLLPKAMKTTIGSGFLFSIRPPPFKRTKRLFHPSTLVIPSDKKGLLRALLQAVTELRAGNTSMQNVVVPLAQEAKRKKILPANLLTPDETTWIFA